ncbi:HAMP domain-containing sensor histidine kinase [Paucibacter sp. AS339]|uniref:sensor histidine kinase n=1 Tax=Paucibacter hankyongi TaxID=3133434 RepID=UPI0030B301B9
MKNPAEPSSARLGLEQIQSLMTRMELTAAEQALARIESRVLTSSDALLARILRLQCRMQADASVMGTAWLEQALNMVEQAALLPGDPLVEAIALNCLALLQSRMRLHHGALGSLERAFELAGMAANPVLGFEFQASRARIMAAAEMHEDLLRLVDELLPQRDKIPVGALHRLLNTGATACFVLADEQLAPPAAPLWLRCRALHLDALHLAETQGLKEDGLLSHLNLSLVEALVGGTEDARVHLQAIHQNADSSLMTQVAGARWAVEFSELLIGWRERANTEAWRGLLAFERRVDQEGASLQFVREYILRAIARHGQAAGDADAALNASHTLLTLQRQRVRSVSSTLTQAMQDVFSLQRMRLANEHLTRQGSQLEQSLAARNAELSQALGRLQAEASIRRAAEAALQQANDELEARVSARTQELELALRTVMQQEKQLALGRVVVGMAHELNTPLGNARMGASVIHDRATELAHWLSDGQVRRQALSETANSLSQCSSLVERSLESATVLVQRLKALSLDSAQEAAQDFDLCRLLHDTLANEQARLSEGGIICQFEMPEQLPMRGAMHALGDVLRELFDNAIGHGLKNANAPRLIISLRQQDGRVRIGLRDNGCGISAEALPRIFDPFFCGQMGREGAGLGLSVVRMLVEELLHGRIHVSSQLGQGTLAELDLPLN